MKLQNKKLLALVLIPFVGVFSVGMIYFLARVLYMFRITSFFITTREANSLIIIIIHFLIGYKLVNYIRVLKQKENKYIVLSFFILYLILPVVAYFIKNNTLSAFNYGYLKEMTLVVVLSIGLFLRNKKNKFDFVILIATVGVILLFAKNVILPFSSQYHLYGNYIGKTENHSKLDELILTDKNGNKVSIDYSKIIVIDFWNKGCSVCFKKFPIVKKMQQKFKNNDKVLVLAVNVYKQKEDINISKELLKETNNEDLLTYYLSEEDAKKFNIQWVPKVVVLKNKRIVFEGNIEILSFLDFMYLK